MSPPTDRLVCYTLSTGGPRAAGATQQLLRSVASLRAHNRAIPVRLFLLGALDVGARRALEASCVAVEEVGDYEAHLAGLCAPRVAEVLSRFPLMHKFTCLGRLEATGAARVLRLDGDTYFFRDVDALFDAYAELDLYAREEPLSRASAFGYRPEAIDEDAYAALAAREGARVLAPFNAGLMLHNHGSFRPLAGRVEEMVRDVFRFSVWLADRTGAATQPDLAHLRAHRARLVDARDEAEALPFPSRNAWIREQVAQWLALGKVPGLRVGTFAPRDVVMGSEFDRVDPGRHVVAHYFSSNEDRFSAWLDDQGLAPSPPGPARGRAPSPPAPSMRPIEELGARLDEAWLRLDHDERAFPALAAEALSAARIHREISGADLVRWLLGAREIPEQHDIEARFGHPPVTVYRGRRFFIEALLWADGLTSVHRHAFSGAFALLTGSSLEVKYRFDVRRRVCSRLLLGDVHGLTASLRAPGDVTAIDHGLVHSTFHLEAPSCTLVVRTRRDDEAEVQYEYLPPTVAHDPFFEDPATTRRLQALGFLRRTRQRGHVDLAADLVARSDLHTAWVVLLDAYRKLGSAARAAPILDAARARHGAAADDLAAALDEELRRIKLRRVSEVVTDPAQRFFLALLQNLPDRASIEALIRQRFPEAAPGARIVAWLEALSGAGIVGVDLGDRLTREIVLALLGDPAPGGVRQRLAAVFDPREVDAQAGAIERQVERIRRTTLAPLFV